MYHAEFIQKVKDAPPTLGNVLGLWAIQLDLPVAKIATAIGATRQSVYNWMKGGEVFVAYRPAVTRVISCMKSSKTAEEAWGKICQE
jgi:hypothetical protein